MRNQSYRAMLCWCVLAGYVMAQSVWNDQSGTAWRVLGVVGAVMIFATTGANLWRLLRDRDHVEQRGGIW